MPERSSAFRHNPRRFLSQLLAIPIFHVTVTAFPLSAEKTNKVKYGQKTDLRAL